MFADYFPNSFAGPLAAQEIVTTQLYIETCEMDALSPTRPGSCTLSADCPWQPPPVPLRRKHGCTQSRTTLQEKHRARFPHMSRPPASVSKSNNSFKVSLSSPCGNHCPPKEGVGKNEKQRLLGLAIAPWKGTVAPSYGGCPRNCHGAPTSGGCTLQTMER